MTDQPTPTDHDLSLVLDGQADPDLEARVAASPDAQARLEELRAAATAVSTAAVPPLDDATIDGLITTALDAPVAPTRSSAGRPRRPAPWLVAAVVIVLMALGLTLVWAGRGSQDDQASAKFDSVGASISVGDQEASGEPRSSFSGGTAADTEQAAAGGHGADTTIASSASETPLSLTYLGAFDSGDLLRAATASSLTGAPSTAEAPEAPSDASVDRCAEQLQVTLSLKAGPSRAGYSTVDDKDVLVYEFPATSAVDGTDTTLVAAVGVAACDEVVIFER